MLSLDFKILTSFERVIASFFYFARAGVGGLFWKGLGSVYPFEGSSCSYYSYCALFIKLCASLKLKDF